MIDLISNGDEYIKKYSSLLDELKNCEHKSQLAYIFDVGINHIKNRYNDLSIDWKSWGVSILKFPEIFKNFNTNLDVVDMIDKFYDYYRSSYQLYVDDLAISQSDYDKNESFVYSFIKKFKNNQIILEE